jgi:alpha-glucosidase
VRTRPCDFQLPIYNKSHADIPRFIERIRELVDSYEDRFTVAEVGGTDADHELKGYTSGARRFNSAYGFNFLHAEQFTPELVQRALAAWPEGAETGWPSWAFSNHDAPRAPSRWAQPQDRAAIARVSMLLLACLRGNIFIYQGEELGLPQAQIAFEQLRDPEAIANWPLTLGRDGARTPMPWRAAGPELKAGVQPWLPVVPEHLALAVDRQERDPASQLAYTRHVLALRNCHEALVSGALQVLEASDDILAFERRTSDQRLLCVFNFADEARDWQPPGASSWHLVESSSPAQGWRLPRLSGHVAERYGP